MVQHKLRILFVTLSHINQILKLDIIIQKICLMTSEYKETVLYFCLKLKFGNKVYDRISMGTLTLVHISRVREIFMMTSFLPKGCTFEE